MHSSSSAPVTPAAVRWPRRCCARRWRAAGVDQVTVASAGTGAWEGAPVSEGAYLVGLEHGLDLSEHRARLLTRELVQRRRPDPHHVGPSPAPGSPSWAASDKVHLLGELRRARGGPLARSAIPFGSDLASYRTTFDELQELIGGVVSRVAGTVR